MEQIMKLYHAGFDVIREPDVYHGRKNADLGQGFYLTDNVEFALRWARVRKGEETVLNSYELDPEGLRIVRLQRDAEWFEYIMANRYLKADKYKDADVIVGPIANDTIFDTLGIITSGFLDTQQAMAVLMEGPAYMQTVIRSEKAARQLRLIGAEVLDPAVIAEYRKRTAQEEKEYQKAMAAVLERF